MKRRWKMAIVLLLATALLAVVVSMAAHPIYCKLLCGEARILSARTDAILEIDGRPEDGICCFKESSLLDGSSSDRLILHTKDPNGILGRHIIVVDPTNRNVLIPNSSMMNYHLVLNRWLIQSDSGAWGVPFGDSKLDSRDPDFQQLRDTISFTIPSVLGLPPGRWNLRIGENE